MKKYIFILLFSFILNPAYAGRDDFTKEHMLLTIDCMMTGYRYYSAARLTSDGVPRDAVISTVMAFKNANMNEEENLHDAIRIVNYVNNNWPLNPDALSATSFTNCAQENSIPINYEKAPYCWSGMLVIDDISSIKNRGTPQSEALEKLKEFYPSIDETIANDLIAMAYAWNKNPAELSFRELLRCTIE